MSGLTAVLCEKRIAAMFLEVAARDFAIIKLAEYLDLEYDVVEQFTALVEDFKDEHRAQELAKALTA